MSPSNPLFRRLRRDAEWAHHVERRIAAMDGRDEVDPLLAACRNQLVARGINTELRWAKNHAAVARALWMHVRWRMSPADAQTLVRGFDRDEALRDPRHAGRQRLEAGRIAERLLPHVLEAEIKYSRSRPVRVKLFAGLFDLDPERALPVWQQYLAGRVTRRQMASLFRAESRALREWALGALRDAADTPGGAAPHPDGAAPARRGKKRLDSGPATP